MAVFRRPVRSRPVGNAISDHHDSLTTTAISTGVEGLSVELPAERAESYLWLLSGRKSSEASLLAMRKLMDKAILSAETVLRPEEGQISAAPLSVLDTFFADLGHIGSIRAAVDSGAMSPSAAFQAYSNIVDAQFQFYDAFVQDRGQSIAGVSTGIIASAYALEMASREVTLVDGALANHGLMNAPVRQLLISTIASRRLLDSQATTLLISGLRTEYLAVDSSPAYRRFQAVEDQILASTGKGPIPVNASAWESASGTYLASSSTAQVGIQAQLAVISASQSSGLLTEAVLAGGIGLLAVVVSVFLLVWFGRKVTGDLTRLDGSVARWPRNGCRASSNGSAAATT